MNDAETQNNDNAEAPATASRRPRPRIAPLAATVKDVALMYGVSPDQVYLWNNHGLMPRTIALPSRGTGKRPRLRWRLAELREWERAGMPPREKWERMKKDF